MKARPDHREEQRHRTGKNNEVDEDADRNGEQGHVENVLALVSHRRAAHHALKLCKCEQAAGGRERAEHNFKTERAHRDRSSGVRACR